VFLDDEVWRLFASDAGPGVLWSAAPALLVFVVPVLALLCAVVWEWLTGGP
jgi:hypothetical protein